MEFLAEAGIKHHLADGPAMPIEAEHVWPWFMDIHQGRQCGMGLQAITWADIHAFFALHETKPSPFELRLIRAFDRAYLTVFATKEKPK